MSGSEFDGFLAWRKEPGTLRHDAAHDAAASEEHVPSTLLASDADHSGGLDMEELEAAVERWVATQVHTVL